MTLWESIVMALVQGVTEFLPVSSSGHLVLTKSLLGIQSPGALWEVTLHLGTLGAVVAVFRRDLRDVIVGFCSGVARRLRGERWSTIWREMASFRLGCYIVLGTAPAAAIGLGLSDLLEGLFDKPVFSAMMIFVTGEILWLSRPHSMMRTQGKLELADSLAIGAAQVAALVPGISRSGTTISTGLIIGVSREEAARFSFLLAVPAILGAAILKAHDVSELPDEQILPMIAGIVVTGVSGYIALRLLLRVVKAGRIHCFAYYCWAASVAGVTYLWTTA